MTMGVTGLDVCGYCEGGIAAAARAAELKSLTVFARDNLTGDPKTYYWRPGMKSLKETITRRWFILDVGKTRTLNGPV